MELEIKNKGFTLVELLVALAAFGLIVIAMTGATSSIIKSQRKAFALQSIQESTRYALESMSKEIRMSVINSGDSGGSKVDILNITNSDNQTFDYQFDNINKKLMRWGQDISPANIDLTGGFYIRKSSFPERSLVTIIIKVESQGLRIEEQAEIDLQNTISSRAFGI